MKGFVGRITSLMIVAVIGASGSKGWTDVVTLRAGDQATGSLSNFVQVSATASPGHFGSLDLRLRNPPAPGAILEVDLFANNASRTPLSSYTWELLTWDQAAANPTLQFFPFGTVPLSPGTSGFLSEWGGTYRLTMISGECDISAVTASIAPESSTTFSTTSVPVITPAPEPAWIGGLAVFGLLVRPSRAKKD
ncbi:MAG TPA: hypothetical protein VM008_12270 [Phycisphaerae bacterium]|nr:hypothetical protein [Phycisphaerae bacterium]